MRSSGCRRRSAALTLAATFLMLGPGPGLLSGCEDPPVCPDLDLPHDCDGACRQCCDDADCGADATCESHACVPACIAEGERCTADWRPCCEGFACDRFFDACDPACSPGECPGRHPDLPFSGDLVCQADGACGFSACTDHGNCRPGTVCFHGDCVTPPACTELDSCQVVPASVVTRPGSTARLAATARMTSGAMAPGLGFDWSSSNEAVASVTEGVVTGGADPGTATVTASVSICPQVACLASVSNFDPDGHDAWIVVVDELTGQPIEGVVVEIHGAATPAATDSTGVARFPGLDLAATPATVSLTHPEFVYLSFAEAASNVLIAHLRRLPSTDKAGGYLARADFSRVACEPGQQCEAKIGIAGASLPGNLFAMSPEEFRCDPTCARIELGLPGGAIDLPACVVYSLGDPWQIQEFKVIGVPGRRVAWGLGGKPNLADLIELLGPVISADEFDVGAVLVAMNPVFSGFHSALVPAVEIVEQPMVPDMGDYDCDEDTQDLIPDYSSFPRLPTGPMVFKVPMDQPLTVQVPDLLPDGAGGWLHNGVLVVAGLLVRDAGAVPLGLAVAADAPAADDVPDGRVEAIQMHVAEVAGRLPEGTYQRVVVALALDLDRLAEPSAPGRLVVAGQVHLVERFDTSLTLRPFLEPVLHTHAAVARAVNVTSAPADMDLLLLRASSAAGHWLILHPPATGPIDLPAAPTAGDRADALAVVAIRLAGETTYQDLIAFNGTNLVDLTALVSDFSLTITDASAIQDCDCTTAGPAENLFALALLLLGLARARRRRCHTPRYTVSCHARAGSATISKTPWGNASWVSIAFTRRSGPVGSELLTMPMKKLRMIDSRSMKCSSRFFMAR